MRYVAAYLLAVLGGKESPSNADIEKILSSVGIEADSTRLSKVVVDLKGKSIDDLIKEGREKLSSMPVGGGVSAAAAPVAAPVAEKKEEKKGLCLDIICDSLLLVLSVMNISYHLSHEFYIDSNIFQPDESKTKANFLFKMFLFYLSNLLFVSICRGEKRRIGRRRRRYGFRSFRINDAFLSSTKICLYTTYFYEIIS